MIDARRIHVAANDGTVILSGSVHSWAERREAERAAWAAPGVTHVVTIRGDVKTYSEKIAAEKVALGVYGVKAIANDVNVRLPAGQQRADSDVAQAVLAALKWNAMVPAAKISVAVSDGWVTLRGQVLWQYQRAAAERPVRDLIGVRGVTNSMTLAPHANVADVRSKIEAALTRSAEVDARRINVVIADGKVILSGNVHSVSERDEARRAAWAAPGVTSVDDRIAVMP